MSDLITTEQLQWAHTTVDELVERLHERVLTADVIWQVLLEAVKRQPEVERYGNTMLLLTVALQKLAQAMEGR